MVKAYSILALLAALVIVASAGDWLGGGYVGQGSYGDIGQHFTDPIFYPAGSRHTSSDPAIRQMEESMDRYSSRYATLGSSNSKWTSPSTTGKSKSTSVGASIGTAASQPIDATDVIDVTGNWHLQLSDGTLMDLELSQSGPKVFGRGSMTSAVSTEWAVASGEITGSLLSLEVVPASGTELYAASIDVGRLHLPGSFTAFRANAQQLSGNVNANRAVASATRHKHDTAKNAIGNVR